MLSRPNWLGHCFCLSPTRLRGLWYHSFTQYHSSWNWDNSSWNWDYIIWLWYQSHLYQWHILRRWRMCWPASGPGATWAWRCSARNAVERWGATRVSLGRKGESKVGCLRKGVAAQAVQQWSERLSGVGKWSLLTFDENLRADRFDLIVGRSGIGWLTSTKFMILAPNTHTWVRGMARWMLKPPMEVRRGTKIPPPPIPPAAPRADARKAWHW